MSDDFQKTLNKAMTNPEFRQLWEADEPEYQAISETISPSNEHGLPESLQEKRDSRDQS